MKEIDYSTTAMKSRFCWIFPDHCSEAIVKTKFNKSFSSVVNGSATVPTHRILFPGDIISNFSIQIPGDQYHVTLWDVGDRSCSCS